MLLKNCVLIVVFLYGVLCQDTNPEWLEPNTTSTTPATTTPLPTTTTTTNQPTEIIPTTTTYQPTTTTPNQPTERIPTTTTTTYPTTRFPTRYPTTRYPTTRYTTTTNRPTRYPPMPSPIPSTTKPPQETCTVSLSKPVIQYYSVFGLIYKSIVQCCYLCCSTKFSYQPYCTKIAMQNCNQNANRYNSYSYGY